MTLNGKLLPALGMTLALLAACDGSDGGNGAIGNAQSQFGPLFAAAFNADPNDVPKDDPDLAIVRLGVTGINLTGTPLDI